jgi:hypothetical protein
MDTNDPQSSFNKDNESSMLSASRFAKVGYSLLLDHDCSSQDRVPQIVTRRRNRGGKKGQDADKNSVQKTSSAQSSANSSVTFDCCDHEQMVHQDIASGMRDGRGAGKKLAGEWTVEEELLIRSDITTLLRRKNIIISILVLAIFVMLAHVISKFISSLEMERTFLLFETKFWCMNVKTMASLENCKNMENIRQSVLSEWYE